MKRDVRAGTSAIATIRELMREKMIVQARSLNICPIIPSIFLNISIGRKIQTEVRVLAVIEVIISFAPRTEATLDLVPFCL